MTAILGAQTDQLATLATRLTTTGTEIDEVQSQTQSTADTVVAEMEGAFQAALGGIEQAMGNLRTTVDAAHGQLGDTTWTGANADRFHEGYGNFNDAMRSFEGAVRTAYEQFDGQMRMVGETINDFQAQVTSSMVQAHASTDSMQVAVSQQQANLEQAMNTGLSFA